MKSLLSTDSLQLRILLR